LISKQRVLVTGAGGFIGRWSIEPLLAAGYEVHAVLSPNSSTAQRPRRPLPRNVEVQRVDLLDPTAIDALVEAVRPTHLLHFAWIATPGIYWRSAENHRWLAASRHLLKSFQRNGGIRCVMAGSCAEYDWSRVEICNERTSPLASEDSSTPYAACKIAMQRSLEEFGRAQGLSTAWGRIFYQFGPGEHPQRLVASVIINLLSGREALCTHGGQIRSFLHVQDVGAAFAALLRSDVEGAVNVGSGDRISIAELLEQVAGKIGRPDLLKLGARTTPPGEPHILVPDITRLQDEAGFRPRWTLDEGLADAIRWWRTTSSEGAGGAPAR
jgi:nucleoside-diphosphate-sugar epimerase